MSPISRDITGVPAPGARVGVPGAGFEPAHPFEQWRLRPPCLPFHHPGLSEAYAMPARGRGPLSLMLLRIEGVRHGRQTPQVVAFSNRKRLTPRHRSSRSQRSSSPANTFDNETR